MLRALVNQCRGVALAMRAVREINPAARLVQTDDLGKTYSTRKLRYQAELENERRWLSFDLLTGRVTRGHPLWTYFTDAGIAESELDWFAENPCPPDIVGINHYLTSERFLDERLERYPVCTHGGNGKDRYADVEAVRVRAEGLAGHRTLLRETWERYGLPVAVTEVHLGCTREEQLRWFRQTWEACRELSDEGVDLRAVTAWSLLGAYDWNKLLTCSAGHYEPGVFDVSGPHRRPTAIAKLIRELARGGEFTHPAAEGPGWWERLERLTYPPSRKRVRQSPASPRPVRTASARRDSTRPLLITGATGTLGRAFAKLCEVRGVSYRLLARREMDIADYRSVREAFAEHEPWAVVNAAGYVRVDDAERERDACFRENTDGAAILSAACAHHDAGLVTFSSDLVFGGDSSRPYVEGDAPAPLGVYGRSKAEAERIVLEKHPAALVVRTGAFFGPWDEHNFVTLALRAIARGEPFAAADDLVVSPTCVPDLVHAALDLLIDGERGVWHLANPAALSWAELARTAAEMAGLDDGLVHAVPAAELGLVASRPRFAALASERGTLMPPLEDALARYLAARRCPGSSS
jgi:dTDP-4-dehydrorhamnose reductase